MKKRTSLSRTLFICILSCWFVGLFYAIWEGYSKANQGGQFNKAMMADAVLFAMALLAAIGGIIGCVVYTIRNVRQDFKRQ